MSQFPKWLYHKTIGAKLINSAEEEKSLGKDWEDSPAKFNEEVEKQAVKLKKAADKAKD